MKPVSHWLSSRGVGIAIYSLLGAVWVAATYASLSLRASVPPFPIFASANDDEMQVFLADSIADGRWLGDWTQTTMSKGPGYPVFLPMAYDLGLNPMVAAQVMYLLGATLVAGALLALVRSRWLPALLYPALAMNPAMFGTPASRVYRESLTAALAILVLGVTLLIAWLVVCRMRVVWRIVVLVPASLVLGVAAGWLTQTRVDTMWIAVAVAPIALGSVFWTTGTWGERGRHALQWAGVGALSLGAVIAIGNRVADLNEQYYGVRVTDDFSAGAFAEMSNLWASVEAGPRRTYVPISAAQRAAVYAISPDAALMERYLDGKKEFFGRSASCEVVGVCDDYAGGWMPWAMRAAASKQTATAAELQDYFGGIRDDIAAACTDGRLTCGDPGLGPGVPPLADIDRTIARANLVDRVLKNGYQGFAAAGVAGAFIATDDPEKLAVWQRTVRDIPNLLNNPMAWTTPQTAARIAELQGRYSNAANRLLLPALLGLGWGLFLTRGRRAAIVGLAVFGACAAHGALLAVWSAGAGAPTGEDFYLIASISFFITGLVLGVWCLIEGIVAFLRWLAGRRSVEVHEPSEPLVSAGLADERRRPDSVIHRQVAGQRGAGIPFGYATERSPTQPERGQGFGARDEDGHGVRPSGAGGRQVHVHPRQP